MPNFLYVVTFNRWLVSCPTAISGAVMDWQNVCICVCVCVCVMVDKGYSFVMCWYHESQSLVYSDLYY